MLSQLDKRGRSKEVLATAKASAEDDRVLVRRFNTGDKSAFAEIANKYKETIYSIATKHIRSHSDLEEIVQDVLVSIHRNLSKFRGDASLRTWIYCITINMARNRYWYLQRRKAHLMTSLCEPIGEDGHSTLADLIASDDESPSQITDMSEFVYIVQARREKLPKRLGNVLAMRCDKGLSYEEIASILCVNVGTVKSRIARARRKLVAEVVRLYPGLGNRAGLSTFLACNSSGDRIVST